MLFGIRRGICASRVRSTLRILIQDRDRITVVVKSLLLYYYCIVMYGPFKKQSLQPKTLLQKLFNRENPENALIELNNLLAEKGIQGTTKEDVYTIEEKYQIDLQRSYQGELTDIYQRFIGYCLEDKKLSDDEVIDLARLKALIGLSDTTAEQCLRRVTEKIYHTELEKALSDATLTEDEVSFLRRLKGELRLPDDITEKIYRKSATDRLTDVVNRMLRDERISSEEEQELKEIADNLNISISLSSATKELFEKYKLYWQIENEDLPVVDPGINLYKGEACHFTIPVNWYEIHRVMQRVRYGGPTVRIKLAAGVYWRMGDLGVQRISSDEWRHVDSGQLFITDRRIIFMGGRGNKNIRLNRILQVIPYQNGLDIQKDAGKSPFLEFSEHTDLAAMILQRVMHG